MIMFMVLSLWLRHFKRSSGSYDEYGVAPSGRRPSAQAKRLGCESACRLPEATPTITIYYYSARKLILILPSHRGWKVEST